MEDNKENKRPSTPKKIRKEGEVLSDPFKTPPRRRVRESALKIVGSPYGAPVPEDYTPLSKEYVVEDLQKQYTEKKNRLKSIFMGFLNQTLLQEWGCEYDAVNFQVRKNSVDDPFQLLSINTHRTFCDRNENYEGASILGFANCLTQCCSQATRREGVSVIFLRNPSKIHLAGVKDRFIYCRTSDASPRHSEFRVERAPQKVQDICEAIEKIYINAPKGKGRNRTLVINVGFFTVEEKDDSAGRIQKKVAIITSNGIYSAREAKVQMGKIEKAIQNIAPEVSILVVDPRDIPRVKHSGTLEHCETVYSDLMSHLASPDNQETARRQLFSDVNDEDEHLEQTIGEMPQVKKIRLNKDQFSKKNPSSSEGRKPLGSIPLQIQKEWCRSVETLGKHRARKTDGPKQTEPNISEGKENVAAQNISKGRRRVEEILKLKLGEAAGSDESGWIRVSYRKKKGNKSTSPTADRESDTPKNKSRKAGGQGGHI